MALTFDRRHEVALKCPGGTKAISLGFQLVETKSETISSTLTNALKMLERGFSMGDFHKVLDGEIQGFLDSLLTWRAKQSRS